MTHGHRSHKDGATPSAAKWVFIGFLLIAGYFLIMEHRAHLSGWLSSYGVWLLLLACPLMHFFMHGGHGHEGHRSDETTNESIRDQQK